MPTAHDAVAAVPASWTALADLRALLVGRLIYDLKGDDPTDFTAVDPDTGEVPPALAYNDTLFWYDPADSSTAHDGTTCLVSDDGKRFKTTTPQWVDFSVLSQGDTTPPGSPSAGDAYIVGAGATGAWSGQDKDIALWTGSTWVFIAPATGRAVYVEDETGYYHYSAAATWTQGLGSFPVSAGAIKASNLIRGGAELYWIVEDQTTTTPPVSPSTGDAYIVGPSATGDWAGHDAKIAQWDGAAWNILAPGQGWVAYDKALERVVYYDTGDGWQAPLGEVWIAEYEITAAVAQQDIALPAGFTRYQLELRGVTPATGNQRILARVSNDGGATFEAGATAYGYQNNEASAATASSMRISRQVANDVGHGVFGMLTIWGARAAGEVTRLSLANAISYDGSNYRGNEFAAGVYHTAEAVDALRLFFESGNIAAGTFILRGWV